MQKKLCKSGEKLTFVFEKLFARYRYDHFLTKNTIHANGSLCDADAKDE